MRFDARVDVRPRDRILPWACRMGWRGTIGIATGGVGLDGTGGGRNVADVRAKLLWVVVSVG